MGVPSGRVRGRLLPLGVAASVAFVAVVSVRIAPAASKAASHSPAPVAGLHLFYRPPVLVRSGQPVRIPVDVVCATARGTPCPATATIDVREATGWRHAGAAARPDLRFDLTNAARRAVGSGMRSGSVAYRVGASSGRMSASVPGGGGGGALRYYVTSDLPSVAVPPVTFGEVVQGNVAQFVPWGSGPARAGLVPGLEADVLGPSSFDVDGTGRILLADPVLGRVTLFAGGHSVWETKALLGTRADVAFEADGGAVVASSPASGAGRIVVRALGQAGQLGSAQQVGTPGDMPSELRTSSDAAYLHVLPEDDWLPATGTGSATTGRPLGGGDQLLKVVDGNAVRLATVSAGTVQHAVELDFSQSVGEIALAEPDGAGGYVAVVHVWRASPPADQYEVVHVTSDDAVRTLSIPNDDYADSMPLSKLRLGGDGALYALQSFPDGVRVVRYDLGGIR